MEISLLIRSDRLGRPRDGERWIPFPGGMGLLVSRTSFDSRVDGDEEELVPASKSLSLVRWMDISSLLVEEERAGY